MRIIDWRGHVLAGAALGDGVTLAEVESDFDRRDRDTGYPGPC